MNTGLRDTYDRIAEDWHKDHQADDWWVTGTEDFLTRLPEGGTILDVGCGSGVKSRFMAERGFRIIGIDISKKLLDIARNEAPSAEFKLLPMEELDTLDETFDGVFSQASLLHVPKREAGDMVRKMTERLKLGGYLYVAVKEMRPGQSAEGLLRENDYGYEYARFFSYYTMSELESYFRKAGLTMVRNIPNPNPAGRTVWLQVIGKK